MRTIIIVLLLTTQHVHAGFKDNLLNCFHFLTPNKTSKPVYVPLNYPWEVGKNYFITEGTIRPLSHHFTAYFSMPRGQGALQIEGNTIAEILSSKDKDLIGYSGGFAIPPDTFNAIPSELQALQPAIEKVVKRIYKKAENIRIRYDGYYTTMTLIEFSPTDIRMTEEMAKEARKYIPQSTAGETAGLISGGKVKVVLVDGKPKITNTLDWRIYASATWLSSTFYSINFKPFAEYRIFENATTKLEQPRLILSENNFMSKLRVSLSDNSIAEWSKARAAIEADIQVPGQSQNP